MVNTPPPPPTDPTDEQDPTGIRALLAGLPDPGPMPASLVDRINASIAAEQSDRQGSAVVVPLAPRRRHWQRAWLAAAAVAAVAVSVPALLSGWGPTGGDTASSFSTRESASDSAAGGAGSPTPPIASYTSPASGTQDRAEKPLGDLRVQASGTAYTRRGLATQARPLADSRKAATAPSAALASAGTSADQLRGCLTALGVETWAPVDGDLATFEGRPAIIALVSTDTGQRVYAVSTRCRAAHPEVLSGPVPLS